MAAGMDSVPDALLDDESVYRNFREVARDVNDHIGRTLGPCGRYVLVPDDGARLITRDSATILAETDLAHPVAEVVRSVARDQSKTYGDGTATAVLLTSLVLEDCCDLVVERSVHPTDVSRAIRRAQLLVDATVRENSVSVDPMGGDETMKAVIRAQIETTVGPDRESIGTVLEDALVAVIEGANGVSRERMASYLDAHLHVIARSGGSVTDTRTIGGVLLKKDIVNRSTKRVEDADVLLVDEKLYFELLDSELQDEDEISPTVTVEEPRSIGDIRRAEAAVHRPVLDRLLSVDPDVVITRKGIDERISRGLQEAGVVLVRRVKPEDHLESVARATGASVVGDVSTLDHSDLGWAGVVEELAFGPITYTRVGECDQPGSVTILTKGGTWSVAEYLERQLESALAGVSLLFRDPIAVPGGGSLETLVSENVRRSARRMDSREALALEAVAGSFADYVGILAANCGLDPTDARPELRRRNRSEWAGVLVRDGRGLGNVERAGVFDPTTAKRSAYQAALQAVEQLITVNGVYVTG